MFQDPLANPTGGSHIRIGSPLLEAILFPFIEKICLGTAQVDDLRATISILFLDGALLAVVGVGHAGPPADDAAALVGAVVALVTDAHQGAGPHVGVTDHTLAITFFTESSDCWGKKKEKIFEAGENPSKYKLECQIIIFRNEQSLKN